MEDIKILAKDFFLVRNVTEIAKDLLGKIIISELGGKATAARIVETEAYDGNVDKACHAFPNKLTPRTAVMFKEGGRSYVYLCYGMHHLLNVVTHAEGDAKAVLIRAVEPIYGEDIMHERRKVKRKHDLTNGPGKLTKALGISSENNDLRLYKKEYGLWLGHKEEDKSDVEIVTTQRVGIDYAEEDALLPWRYYIKNNPYISKK
ncbi:DNA-3-methyladenine glycosylase [Echinicola marina]|uniref:DNA-3-methyladenine glycosylase n=1 Tax=Echinicola marina TaxID=2859768 RepID=UPI001CF62D7A|nr:DNA-3-methyladenine glycosylase [Echinicola marina]UCS92650.1 DNA-3-methyladenine glycosylase [Echinicola marina]